MITTHRDTEAPRRDRLLSASVPRCVVVVLLALAGTTLYAHDIPNDVVVQAFLKPEGNRARLLLRVPMKGMIDVEVPLRDRGYLNIPVADEALRGAALVWIARNVRLYEDIDGGPGPTPLPEPQIITALASLPSDQSYREYESALAHIIGPRLPDDTQLYWEEGLLDVLLEYPIVSDRSRFWIEPGLRRLAQRVTIALRLQTPDGRDRAFELHDDPGIVALDPRWHQAAARFVRDGFHHILDGVDHLLFLLCLVIPLRRIKTLVGVVTAFTVAHSITLIASAYDLAPTALWFPPLVETLIAASIVYMALENIVGVSVSRRWIITFCFGLVHGFGFSFALRESLQFAGSHLLTSLLSFNLGVELGQLLVLAIVVPMLELLFRYGVAERMGTIILSALVAHTGWHWLTERGSQLMEFPVPTLDLATLAVLVQWLTIIVAAAAVAWFASVLLKRGRRSLKEDSSGTDVSEPVLYK
jgi:hypothetical protein